MRDFYARYQESINDGLLDAAPLIGGMFILMVIIGVLAFFCFFFMVASSKPFADQDQQDADTERRMRDLENRHW